MIVAVRLRSIPFGLRIVWVVYYGVNVRDSLAVSLVICVALCSSIVFEDETSDLWIGLRIMDEIWTSPIHGAFSRVADSDF